MSKIVRRTPESEQWVNDGLIDKPDKYLLALMRAFGVCPRCAKTALKMLNSAKTAVPREVMPDEVVGFPMCSETCANGVMAAVTASQH